jgi:type IV secretory pathway VirB10-like protein
MTDELTPEEKEALKNLPRERMPVGLEARVVEAMREHGFLTKRRRTIVLTGSRVAGLVAASVALMIGAYSIGLHRGGGDVVVPPAATLTESERGPVDRAPPPPPEERAERIAARGAGEPAVAEADEKVIPESQEEKVATPTAPPAPSDEALADRTRQSRPEEEAPAQSRREAASPPATEALALSPAAEDAGRARMMKFDAAPQPKKQSFTFLLNGSPLSVEADSVRVTEDERGRILHIYTPDGVIRLRLAGD